MIDISDCIFNQDPKLQTLSHTRESVFGTLMQKATETVDNIACGFSTVGKCPTPAPAKDVLGGDKATTGGVPTFIRSIHDTDTA